MSYNQNIQWDRNGYKERINRIRNILDGPVIRGVKHIYSKEEKLVRSKPHTKADFERQFRHQDKDFLKSFKGFEGW